MDYVINDWNTLRRLRSDWNIKREFRRIKIQLDTDSLNLKEIEHRINKFYFACGCTSGAVGVYVGLAAIGTTWLLVPQLVNWVWWNIVIVMFLAGIAGKLIGLFVNRYLLVQTLTQIEDALACTAFYNDQPLPNSNNQHDLNQQYQQEFQ